MTEKLNKTKEEWATLALCKHPVLLNKALSDIAELHARLAAAKKAKARALCDVCAAMSQAYHDGFKDGWMGVRTDATQAN